MTASEDSHAGPGERPPSARRLLIGAAMIVLLEAVVLGMLIVAGLRGVDSQHLPNSIAVATLLGGYVLALMFGAVMLAQIRPGARSPLIVTHILQALIAFNLREQTDVALGLLIPALVVVGILISPPGNRFFADPSPH